MNPVWLCNLFSGLLLIVTALLVARGRRFDQYIRPFLFLSLVNISGILAIGFETAAIPQLWSVGYFLLFFYISFLPSAWFLLSSSWGLDPAEYRRKSKLPLWTSLIASTAMFVYLNLTRGIDIGLDGARWYLDLNDAHFWVSAFLVVGVTAGLYSLEICYRSSLGLSREKIMRSFFPLLAYGVGLLSVATVAMMYRHVSDWMMTLIFLLAALVSLPLARHFILFDRANDGIMLTSHAKHSSITIVIVGAYLLVMGGIGQLLVRYNLDEGMFLTVVILIIVIITFMILVVSQAVRSRFQTVPLSGTAVPAAGIYTEEWKEFTEEISGILSTDLVCRQTSQLLSRLMKIDNSFFVVKDITPSRNYVLHCGNGVGRAIAGEKLQFLTDWLYRLTHPVVIVTLKEKAKKEAEELTALEAIVSWPVFLIIPLLARQQFLGFWCVGFHNSGRELSSEEIAFIETAANPVALTILGAKMTEELITAKEMESFHRVSSFVLHDLKNSVAMLSMLLQNADKNMGNPEFQKDALATISKAVDRQKTIIARLTEQKSSEKLSLEKTNLANLIKRTIDRAKLNAIDSLNLKVEVDEQISLIADAEKIGSVFENLVINAAEAMPQGGKLDIQTIPCQIPDMVAVSFKDTGQGMTSEFISTSLFKPFSSTKKHGLGIGMYQAREIVVAHKGRIEVKSQVGQGTEFIVYLPGER